MKISIVGNSGITQTDNEEIEDSDIVVRFNNYATRANIQHTRDRFRCDVLFSTFDLHSHSVKPKDAVIGIPFPFKAKEIYPKLNRWYKDSRHWMINPYENMKMCEELNIDSLGACHPLPSLGFTALWHMQNWSCMFYICGFSWYYSEGTGLFQNWDLKNKNYPKTWNHNYPKEIEWIIKNLLPKNNIMFSSECNRLLKIAQKSL